jgi:cell wall-associated NlpC family hydrolase
LVFRGRNVAALFAAISLTVIGAVPASAVRSGSNPFPSRSTDRGSRIVRTALSFRGARYRYGGTGRHGFDCSGFTKYLYGKSEGVGLPRTAAQQYHSGRKVAWNDIKPGDLLFFSTHGRRVGHVGVYAGNGKMVHAANPRRGVTIDNPFSGYWARRLVGIRRPVA